MQVAVSHVPDDPADVVWLARAADEAGLAFLGIADTPALRGAAFPTLQHVAAATDRLRVGTFVTNPVLRHPTVLATDFQALGRLYPGRVVAGLGSGDSAVRSVGLRPATTAAVADAARTIRQRTDVPIWMAASGLRMADRIPAQADGIIIGGGLEPNWLRRMIAAAEQSAGHRLERWAFVVAAPGDLAEFDSTDARRVLTSVVNISRHALQGKAADRDVPAQFVAGLDGIYAGYDVAAYGDPDGVNARLLDAHHAERDYLLDRFAVQGDLDAIAGRLNALAADPGLDGVVLTTAVTDPMDIVTGVAGRLVPLVADVRPGA